MIDARIILLATSDPGQARLLANDMAQRRPNIRTAVFDPSGPEFATDGETAMPWFFIDWLLPEMSGLELCRRLREGGATRRAHLTLVLDSLDPDLRRRALAAGADDYMLAPLTVEAIASRLGAAPVAPPRAAGYNQLVHGELTIDLAAFQVRFRERPLTLRPNEFRLLTHFVENPDQVFSRASLIRHLGKEGGEIDERTVDVWIGRLRRGLRAHGAPDPLRTVRSLGYVLDSRTA